MVLSVVTSTNALKVVTTVMPRLPVPIPSVTANYALTPMTVFQLMPGMPMKPVQIVMVPTAAHVIVVRPMTVVLPLTMMNLRSE